MSKLVVDRLVAQFGEAIEHTDSFRGDDSARVARARWVEVATFLRQDAQCAMNHFVDLTAVDYPEREPELPRFDVVLHVRSLERCHRVRLKTRVGAGEALPTLTSVWAGADWAEREAFDMFGIRFEGHPDLRRILMYEEFEGHPLCKDYPIERTQPLVPYRQVSGALNKLPPFGRDEGQPWGRVRWSERLAEGDASVSPSIAVQQGERTSISQSSAQEGNGEA